MSSIHEEMTAGAETEKAEKKKKEYPFTIVERGEGWDTCYFTEPARIGSFDGTANGYGYKSKQALYKCYSWHVSKSDREQKYSLLGDFVQKHYELARDLIKYMEAESFYRMKDGDDEAPSINDYIKYLDQENPAWAAIMREAKPLHKTLNSSSGFDKFSEIVGRVRKSRNQNR